MLSLELTEEEGRQLLNLLATAQAPWVVTNPMINKLAAQLRVIEEAAQRASAAQSNGEGRAAAP